MEFPFPRCGGIDVHKKSAMTCIRTPEHQETRTFGTMTDDLETLAAWLESHGVTHVAMESTGVYWIPIYNVLEEAGIEVVLVNAQHVKHVPGRKTDVKDAEWLAELMQMGLLRGSRVPEAWRRDLRQYTRYRRSLVEERTREVNRIQKGLEYVNIKLGDVATDVMGKSGLAMLNALIEGEDDPEQLANLAKGKLNAKRGELKRALKGRMNERQRELLAMQIEHIAFINERIAQLDAEIAEQLRPFNAVIDLLDTAPGIGRRSAEDLIAELGIDMSGFPTAGHCASWAKLCPGSDESAGKRRSGKTGKGNRWLRSVLIEAALSAARTRGTYANAFYRRLAARRGKKKAAVALAHHLLVSIYHMLVNSEPYQELGATFYDQMHKERTLRRSVKRIEALGYKVTIEAA